MPTPHLPRGPQGVNPKLKGRHIPHEWASCREESSPFLCTLYPPHPPPPSGRSHCFRSQSSQMGRDVYETYRNKPTFSCIIHTVCGCSALWTDRAIINTEPNKEQLVVKALIRKAPWC